MTLRIAIAVPARHRISPLPEIIATLVGALRRQGCDVETFAERPLAAERHAFHYLRIDERHRKQPFDACVYPLGRDAVMFSAAMFCMQRLPGLAWLLDSAPAHIQVGQARYAGGYSESATIPDSPTVRQVRLAKLLASGRGIISVFKNAALTAAYLRGQPQLAASTLSLCLRLTHSLGTPIVHLPLHLDPLPLPAIHDRLRRVIILDLNVGNPDLGLRVATRLARLRGSLEVEICISPKVLSAAGVALAVDSEVNLIRDPSYAEKLAKIDSADAVLMLDPDTSFNTRLLCEHAVARGRLVMAPDVPTMSDFSRDEVLKLRPGVAMSAQIEIAIRRAWHGISDLGTQAAAALRQRLPSIDAVAKRLVEIVGTTAAAPDLGDSVVMGQAWQATAGESDRDGLIRRYGPGVRALLRDRLRDARYGILGPESRTWTTKQADQ